MMSGHQFFLVPPLSLRSKNLVPPLPMRQKIGSPLTEQIVAAGRGYDTCFWKRLVMGYADC